MIPNNVKSFSLLKVFTQYFASEIPWAVIEIDHGLRKLESDRFIVTSTLILICYYIFRPPCKSEKEVQKIRKCNAYSKESALLVPYLHV